MLTRLVVSGFKNLVDIDVSFGPFTCIAGTNGVGKSNLLDAIQFLSALADRPLIDAALSVRDAGDKTGDVRGLFHHAGDRYGDTMSFAVEMIIPPVGVDDLGQEAKASSTFVSYSISLRRREDNARHPGSLELIKEELKQITRDAASEHLPFHPSQSWREHAIKNSQSSPSLYISTEGEGDARLIKIHQDGGSSGRPQVLRAANLPRTALSAANAAESPTATLAKRELQSWRLLQLEPASLRAPDNFTSPFEMASDGAHLPAALYHLATVTSAGEEDEIYSDVANRLAELIDDVRSVGVDRDEKRQLLTLQVTGRDGTTYPARALSDGTLRFLALAVLSLDTAAGGLICLEEPENGIHPERIPAMIRLLQDLTTDTNQPVSPGNSIRQVIINTHSPAVVMQVPEESLVVAETTAMDRGGTSFRALQLRCLAGTWREGVNGMKSVAKGRLLGYLNPVAVLPDYPKTSRRVIDRSDIRQLRIPLEDLAG